MAAPQYLLYQKGGTIYIDVPVLPSAATVRIVDGGDTQKMAHVAATLSTINTTLSAAASALNVQLTVASNTGFSVGKTFWIQDDPEEALVRAVDGGTVRLRRPLFYDHVNGAKVEGARVTCSVNAQYANALFWDGRCEWNIDGTTYYSAVECVRYPMQRLSSAQDLFDCEPKLADLVDAETDIERMLDNAHDAMLGEIAKRSPEQRSRVFTGTTEFKMATAAMAMYQHMLRRGDVEDRETWWREFERRLESVVCTTPRDANQDGAISSDERMSARSVILVR